MTDLHPIDLQEWKVIYGSKEKMTGGDDKSFMNGGGPSDPYTFIQWKGTHVCMDFHCDCGESSHFDGYFAYTVQCQYCGTVWEMPSYAFPRKADARTNEYWRTNPKLLEKDEEHR